MRPIIKLAVLGCTTLIAAAACGSSTKDDNTTSTSGTSTSGTSSSTSSGTPAGPGADLKCTSSGKNAYDTYQSAGFVAVNEEIFSLVDAEIAANGTKNLGTAFTLVGKGTPPSTTDDLATFEGNLAAFLVYVYGGPDSITYTDGKTYTGPQDMTAAHTGLGITESQYMYFLSNIVVKALTNKGVKTEDVSSCFAGPVSDPTFIATIVGH
jgi:hypothetical protein